VIGSSEFKRVVQLLFWLPIDDGQHGSGTWLVASLRPAIGLPSDDRDNFRQFVTRPSASLVSDPHTKSSHDAKPIVCFLL
jgi:hypothetical protein